ncbi:MAG: BrnT family toxin [Pyrinomonadaceae bacterium]
MEFAWDPDKRKKVLSEHNVDFEKIKDIFGDPFAVEFIGEKHSSDDELRYGIIGVTAEYALSYLVFTEDDPNNIRFITARKAEAWMVNKYEQERRRI